MIKLYDLDKDENIELKKKDVWAVIAVNNDVLVTLKTGEEYRCKNIKFK